MPYKLVIAEKNGKSWKLEITNDILVGKSLGDTIQGKELAQNLEGYELQIKGASDIAGFPHNTDHEGPELRRVLFKRGWGMHNTQEGLRVKKSIRGKQLSEKTAQINFVIIKHGSKPLAEIFSDQNKPKEKAAPTAQ